MQYHPRNKNMVLGMLLVLLAAARWNDIRLYGAGFGLSITGFLNLETVYTLVGSDDEWLSSDTSREFAMAVGFAETAGFAAGFHRVGYLPPWSDFSTGKSGNHRKR